MTHNIDGVDTHQPDAFDDAMTDGPSYFAGQVAVDAYTCVLIRGQQRPPYDPAIHAGLRTSTAITFNIAPLDPTHKMIERGMVNWSQEYKGVVRPSVEMLAEKIATVKNLTIGEFNPLREMTGMFVIGEYVPKPDNKPGETYTTLSFKDAFVDMAACEAAYAELRGETVEETPNSAERTSLAMFLPGLWEGANHDAAAFQDAIRANPLLAAHFDMSSAEVKAIVASDPSSDIPM